MSARTAKLTGGQKGFLRRSQAVGVVRRDGEPDDAEEEIGHHKPEREPEDARVPPRRKVVDRDGDDEHRLGHSPDERAPLDVVVADSTREVDLPYRELRDNVVRRSLVRMFSSWC